VPGCTAPFSNGASLDRLLKRQCLSMLVPVCKQCAYTVGSLMPLPRKGNSSFCCCFCLHASRACLPTQW